MAVKQEFESRFAKHKDELEWLFMELYHNREGLEVLEREMAEAYNARSAELKALDKARSADPEWYKRGFLGISDDDLSGDVAIVVNMFFVNINAKHILAIGH